MYKTILVHVDATPRSAQRTAIAAKLALENEAHLVGTAVTGLSAYLFPPGGVATMTPPIIFPLDDLRAEADGALDAFEALAARTGVSSIERRRIDDDAGLAIALQARYADLVVISQTADGEFAPRLRSDFPEYVLLNSARPVLVLPAAGAMADIGRQVMVAWNGSASAVRAITSALPLLRRAAKVNLVVLNGDDDGDVHGEDPGADMALYLARHGVRVALSVVEAGGDTGQALLSCAAGQGADLIVMGAYGHSRLHELLLGGASRTALASSPLPLWMAH